MNYILLVLAGALLCNAIPHLASGLRGEPFPTPFATPRGVGHSSPVMNFVWGTGNLLIGLEVLSANLDAGDPRFGRLAVIAGFVGLGIHLAHHFGRVRAGALPTDRREP